MTMPAEAWLRSRIAAAPERLRTAMVEALPHHRPDLPVPEALAEGSLVLYRAVLRGTGGREDALALLAADALLTHAFEAQAEADPNGLGALAERFGARGRLREALP